MPSFILIHPTVWPQYTNVTDRQDRQRSDSIGRTVLQMVAPKPQVSVMVMQRVSVVGVAGWRVILTGWPPGPLAGDGGRGQSGRGRRTLPCQPASSRRSAVQVRVFTLGLAGRGDGYQCGLDCGRSSEHQKLMNI